MALRIITYGNVEVDSDVINHNFLTGRTLPNQHTVESISNLVEVLAEKYVKPETGIPILDLGFKAVKFEELDALSDSVDSRTILINSDIAGIDNRTTAIEDFLNNLFVNQSSGSDHGQTIEFKFIPGMHEEFIAQPEDRIFNLLNAYTIGNHTLQVYKDGVLMRVGEDYTETSPNQITFFYDLEGFEYVTIHAESVSTVVSPVHEEIISVAGQTVFDLQNPFKVGEHTLSIYAEGKRLNVGKEYIETNPKRITLLTPSLNDILFVFRQESVMAAGKILFHENEYQQRSWKLNYDATVGQIEFLLSETFIPGSNSIIVTVEGLLMLGGISFDYTEKDSKTIKFNYSMDGGEVVSIVSTVNIFNWHEVFVTVNENQKDFTLQNIYYTGRNDIIVYENGLMLSPGDDYVETNNNTIQLLDLPPVGSKIVIYKRR